MMFHNMVQDYASLHYNLNDTQAYPFIRSLISDYFVVDFVWEI
jgi:hypothetical protein